MKDLKKIIGRRIARERKQQELSQEKLAELVGVHRTFIGKIERGEKNLTIDTVQEIGKALNLSLEVLFKGQ